MTPAKRRRAWVVIEGGKKPEQQPPPLLTPFHYWAHYMATLSDALIGFRGIE